MQRPDSERDRDYDTGDNRTPSAREIMELLTQHAQHLQSSAATLPSHQNALMQQALPLDRLGNVGPSVAPLMALRQAAGDTDAVQGEFNLGNMNLSALGQPNVYHTDTLQGTLPNATGRLLVNNPPFHSYPASQFPSAQRQQTLDDEIVALLQGQSRMGLPPSSQHFNLPMETAAYLPGQSQFHAGADFASPYQSTSTAPMDTLSRLRQELAASNQISRDTDIANALARSSMLHPPSLSDVLAQREALFASPAASASPFRPNQLDWLAPHEIEALLRGQAGVGNQDATTSPQSRPLVFRFGFPDTSLNQQYPDTGAGHELDRAEATRFLASQGMGAPPGMLLSRPEGKEDESKRSRAETKGDDQYQWGASWDELVAGNAFSVVTYRGLVSDSYLAIVAQVEPCALSHEDRVGLYKTRDIGFPGICCKYCGGMAGFGRFFPNSLASLINGNICASIVNHINNECRRCPDRIRHGIRRLEQIEQMSPFSFQRGARRQFFNHVWNTIRQTGGGGSLRDNDTPSRESTRDSHAMVSGGSNQGDAMDAFIPWDLILANSELVQREDRYLVLDSILAAMAQTKSCRLTENDRVGRCRDHKLGSLGLCCKHCDGKAGAFGRYFPSNLQTMSQQEVSNQVVRHITQKCAACPPMIRNAILQLVEYEATQVSKRFPSRMVFFRRVWHRLQYGATPTDVADENVSDEDTKPSALIAAPMTADDIPWERLVQGSPLVSLVDRGLVADSQFAALAQMEPCRLTVEDRVGYNKDRAVGFVGLRCRFCQGRPGFGRYFPNTVRNFEKTSARETMVSHIALFCQSCPDEIRNALSSLQRIESSRDGSSTMRALVYGSGKLFFRRVWDRLHPDPVAFDDSKPASSAVHTEQAAAPLHARDDSSSDETDSSGDMAPAGHEGVPSPRKRPRLDGTDPIPRKRI